MNLIERLQAKIDAAVRAVRAFFYRTGFCGLGKSLYCPVCDGKVAGFLPLDRSLMEPKIKHGWPYTPADTETINAQACHCPHCGASDRERLYALYLRRYWEDRPTSLLDIAPAHGFREFLKRRSGIQYRCADLCRTNVDDRLDITDMHCYADRRFDAVICSHVLEHVPDDRKAMRELYRVMKPGAWAIIMVPINLKAAVTDEDPSVTDVGERWRRFGQDDHIRLYAKRDFVARLRETGFEVAEWRAADAGPGEFQRCAITPQSVLYISTRPNETQ